MADTSTTAAPKRKRSTTTKSATARKPAGPKAAVAATPDVDAPRGAGSSAGAHWRDQANEFAETAKATARDAATTAKNTTGDALAGLSKLISETAETVDSKLGPQYGDYARKAAETLAGASRTLDEKDIDELTEDARNFVRRSPAVTIGAAAVVGFVLMRMMRGGGSKDDA